VLVALCALATLSLLTVPFLGDRAIAVHVAFDLMLFAYGYGLIRRRHVSAEREIKVRMLYPDRPTAVADPVVVPMRRTANG
jgi:hypothetical protein